jgi:hypothetical protein
MTLLPYLYKLSTYLQLTYRPGTFVNVKGYYLYKNSK